MLVNTRQLHYIMEGWGGEIGHFFLGRFKRHRTGLTPKIQQKKAIKWIKMRQNNEKNVAGQRAGRHHLTPRLPRRATTSSWQ